VKYQSQSGSNGGTTSVQGNPWSDNNDITFSGSGDLENGMTVGYAYTMSDAVFSSSSVTLDMGDSGKLAFGHDSAHGGIDTIKDKMPTAGEEVWDDIGTGDSAGVTDLGADPSLYYSINLSGITASASYARTGLGTENSIALVASDLVEGAEFGIGTGTDVASATSEDDMTTAYAKYSTGPVTFGVQLSEIDKTAAGSDIDREAAAISFAVNENLSLSWGISTVEYEDSTKTDAESTGVSASYTMGGMTIGAVSNKTDSFAGTAGTDKEFTEVSLTFAF
ncbi:porin, partial [Candidatus Pelagibacter sp.]|nr:porin [Candidatus Pelagibacter sp.]